MPSNVTKPQAAAIVDHYRAKGYRKQELRRVIERHVRLLSVLDPGASDELEQAVLADTARERARAERRACVEAFKRRQEK